MRNLLRVNLVLRKNPLDLGHYKRSIELPVYGPGQPTSGLELGSLSLSAALRDTELGFVRKKEKLWRFRYDFTGFRERLGLDSGSKFCSKLL